MSKELILPEDKDSPEGIRIEYIKSRDVLCISGFYDDCVGIQGTKIKFRDFCDRLGIDLKRKRDKGYEA